MTLVNDFIIRRPEDYLAIFVDAIIVASCTHIVCVDYARQQIASGASRVHIPDARIRGCKFYAIYIVSWFKLLVIIKQHRYPGTVARPPQKILCDVYPVRGIAIGNQTSYV